MADNKIGIVLICVFSCALCVLDGRYLLLKIYILCFGVHNLGGISEALLFNLRMCCRRKRGGTREGRNEYIIINLVSVVLISAIESFAN